MCCRLACIVRTSCVPVLVLAVCRGLVGLSQGFRCVEAQGGVVFWSGWSWVSAGVGGFLGCYNAKMSHTTPNCHIQRQTVTYNDENLGFQSKHLTRSSNTHTHTSSKLRIPDPKRYLNCMISKVGSHLMDFLLTAANTLSVGTNTNIERSCT